VLNVITGEAAKFDVRSLTDGIRAVYQPLVRLEDRAIVGYEALARGPEGHALGAPDLLFAAARDHGVTAEVDWACRTAAFKGALEAGIRSPSPVFVNVEPDVLDHPRSAAQQETLERAISDLKVVYEITERAVADRPSELLAMVEQVRSYGWGIALDDVGADWRSLALMPFIRPDVVKLDRALVQRRPLTSDAIICEAVRLYAAQSGAQILAEGIETEEQLQRALTLGATLGQGWLFGRPGPLSWDAAATITQDHVISFAEHYAGDETPVQVVERAQPMEIARKSELLAMSRAMERRAVEMTEPCVILGTFQTVERFTPRTAEIYSTLAQRSAFVAAFGEDMPSEPAPGVRGANLPDNHRLTGEWDVLVVGPYYAGALIARDLGDDGPDMDRRFSFAHIHDRELVLRAARSLMLKITGLEHDLSLAAEVLAA
jgi:EAL domain-containing protein (putative c-di-GMP-specific phosphodiesterase class I)/DICT domain-containing protein